MHIPQKVIEFKNSPISHRLVAELTRTTMQFGVAKGQCLGIAYDKLLWDAMIVNELRYLNSSQKQVPSAEKVITDIYSQKSNIIKSTYEKIQYASNYVLRVAERYRVLPATDFLKIHKYLNGGHSIEHLSLDMSMLSEELWQLLIPFYGQDNDFPKLLEAGIIMYCMDVQAAFPLHPFCKEIILQYALNGNFELNYKSTFVAKQLLLYNDSKQSIENYLEGYLQILFNAALSKRTILIGIQDMYESIEYQFRNINGSKINLAKTKQLFSRLAITNCMAEEVLGVSTKTAIGYLKELERTEFLLSVNSGKQKIYLNSKLCDCINEC